MSKEYEIKTKMEQEQLLQLKMLFLLGYWVITWKLLFRAGGMTFGGEGVGGGGGGLWGGGGGGGGGGGNEQFFSWCDGIFPHPPVRKTLQLRNYSSYFWPHISFLLSLTL